MGRIILSVLVLLSGFLQGPFDHIHPEELDHPAISGLVHIHSQHMLAEHQPSIASHTDDDDEVDVLWSVTTSPQIVLHVDAELGECVAVPSDNSLVSVAVSITRHRGHDPPEFSPKIPGAPPA